MHFLNVGFNNTVNIDNIISITGADSSPARRARQNAENINKFIDATNGRKTKSLIFANDHIIGSCIEPKTLWDRLENLKK